MSRSDFEHVDKYAFYLAYGQQCGYCNKHVTFGDVQIDHIVPQRLAKDSLEWQRILADYGLSPDFGVDSDENRMCSCGQDNCRKSGDVLPVGQAIILLNIAAQRAPFVKKIRSEKITERRLGRTLADVQKGWSQSDSFRDDLLAMIRPELPEYSAIAIRPWDDQNERSRVKRLLGEASEALLAWPQDISGRWIERNEFSEVETALSGDQSTLLALLGPPGSGKSAMLARIGNALRDNNSILLAIKADFLPASVGSLNELDEWLRVPESLPVLIGRLAAESRITILIDQLDALSDLMDTRTERLSALLSLVDRLLGIPGVKIVISCRVFDAMHDLRLRGLIERSATKKIELTDPTWDAVCAFLAEEALDARQWPDCVKQVLRRPQHLKLFLKHLNTTTGRPVFENYHAMLETVVQERVLRPFGARAVAALGAIASEMATREELWLPRARIEQQFQRELAQLLEAGLVNLSPDLTRIGFDHQTVFDFLRARSLVMGSRSLFADVKARQDGLAIRGETWSSIVYLRNADFNVYRRELSDLLGSSEIRAHIKILLIEFLGTVSEPTAEEAACVRPLLENPDLRPHIMRAIAKKSDWFRLMRSAVARSCDFGPQAAYQAAWVLAPAFAFDRSFVMECLKEWSENQEFDHAIYHALSELSEWDDDAFSVLQRIITRTDFAEVWISKIAQDISRSRADLACRAVRIKLDRALSKALEECTPESPPPQDAPIDQQIAHLLLDKGRDPLRRLLRHHGEWFGLDDVAKNGPGFFVETIWTWVEATASQLCRRSASGAAHRYRDDYEWHFGENISSYLASAMWSAVSSYATAEPERFLMWASKAAESEMLSVHRLIVHGLREIATLVPRFVVDYLVSDGRRFAIGNYGGRSSNHQTLALLQAVSPILTDQELGRLLKFIECWRYCDPSKAEDAQRWNEEARLTLYSALPIDRLPLEIREKLSTQPRARESFPEEMDSERKGGMVTSPVKVEEMQNMSDAELLKTLEEYRDDRQRNTDFRLGGSTEVALQFAEFAAENPDRAISVIRQLQPDKSQLLASRGFGAISRCDKITADDVVRLARELIRAGFSSRDFRYELSWGLVSAVQRGDGLPDDLICYLRGILCEPEPTNDGDESTVIERSQKKEERKSILWDQHAKAFPGGNFPALFAITLGLLRRKPADYDQWLNVLENHLRTPENPAVWIGLIEYFRFLVNGSRERSTAFIQALVSRFPEAVSTHEGVRFMAYCREWLPQSVFDDLLRQIKSSDWRLAEQAVGEILVLRSGSVPEDEASNSRLEVLLAAPFITDTHLGMIYSAAATWTTPGIRELSHRVLMAAIPSADSETAEALMEVFMLRGPRRLPTDALTAQLLGAIATVPKLMLTIKTNDLVDRLKELLQDGYSPVEIGNLTRGIVDAAGDSIASMATALSVSAADLIDIAITIQKFPDAKPNGTWVFERLLILNAYPIAKTLIGLDRRF